MKDQELGQSSVENIDAELVGIIYEAALDPHMWPDLLEALVQGIGQIDADGSDYAASAEKQSDEQLRFTRLLPHFNRALTLNRRHNDASQERQISHAIIDQLPIGVVVLDAGRVVISSNRRADEILSLGLGLSVEAGRFRINDHAKEQLFDHHLAKLLGKEAGQSNTETVSFVVNGEEQAALSLLMVSDGYAHYDDSAEHKVTLFIASPFSRHSVSYAALASLFKLSPAEARLAASLTQGVSIGDAATRSGVSRHTARTQLKNIFQKTGTHKQAELVKLILTSPAAFASSLASDTEPRKDQSHFPERLLNEELLQLVDGRGLCFCEYGDPNGLPIVFFHGIFGSRYERHPDDSVAEALGIRLIVPDRAGYGRSDACFESGYLHYVDDIVQLVDYLKIDKFAVFGLSIGAIYAAACAYRWPKRLLSVTFAGATLPFRSFADVVDLLPSYKMHFAFCRYLPNLAKLFPEMVIKNACSNPARFFKYVPLNETDRQLFLSDALYPQLAKSMLAGSGKIQHGFTDDIMKASRPCDFSITEIQNKMVFWHGTEDLHSPIRRVREMVDSLNSAQLLPTQGGGHFFLYEHWEKILKSIIGNSR